MRSDLLTPRAWLALHPLQAGERLYLVVGAASDAAPHNAYYQRAPLSRLIAIWSDTPYADWKPVMPYLAELKPDSAFLQWIAQTDAEDWGWLAVSTCTADVVREHLRSLTQVRMPDRTEVFFRFWDGRHLFPILEQLGTAGGDLLPVFSRYLINHRHIETGIRSVTAAKPWPWWDVPQALIDALVTNDSTALIDNLMQWLGDECAELFFALPEANLRQKVERFVHEHPNQEQIAERLVAQLTKEVTA